MTNEHRDAEHSNKTQLDVEKAAERGIIHRDYIAHALRWSFALRYIDSGAKVLDLGCGDGPLLRVLYTNKFKPALYGAVDIRPGVAEKFLKTNFPVEFRALDATEAPLPWPDGTFDVAVSYEMVEHIPPAAIERVLGELFRELRPGGLLLISTPNFNGEQATNHIHEWTRDELNAHLAVAGFAIEAEFGTFASQRDILPVATPAEREVFDSLRRYYDSNVLAVLLAPNHPAQSRNVLRVCRKPGAPSAPASAATEGPEAEAEAP